MLTPDSHLILNFIMIELFGTILLLLAVTIFIYAKRCFARKSLTGCKVLITNGGSAFSIELAELLRTKHGCQSILLETQAKHTENSFKRTSNGIPTINCNPLDNAELAQLSKLLEREYGGNIDVIIDNGISNISKEIRQNCGTFVDYTSERLRVTINLLLHFIPKMNDLSRGHFVTIQTVDANKSPALSSNDEITELISHLTQQKSTFSADPFKKQKIFFSTVLWNHPQNNNNDQIQSADIRQLAERIIDGIQANRSVIRIDHKSSFTDNNSVQCNNIPNKTQN